MAGAVRPGTLDRSPRAKSAPPVPAAGCPQFSFRFADGAFCGDWLTGDHASAVLTFIKDVSSSTWSEIRSQTTGARTGHRKHHEMGFEEVSSAAQRRISVLRLDEQFSELFRFRVGGRQRLWGFEVEGTFYVLWWDPDHQVYPVEKG